MSLFRLPILRHGLTNWDKSLLPETEVESRLHRVRRLMRLRGLDALVVYGDMARSGGVAYLTNFHPFDPRMPALVLVTPENIDAIFKVTSRDLTYVSRYVWVDPRSVDFLSGNLADKLAEIVAERGLQGKARRVGVVGRSFAPISLLRGIEEIFANGKTEPADHLFASLRRAKSATEHTLLRLAAAKCEAVLAELAEAFKPGMMEMQLTAHADYLARRAGAQDVEVLLHAASAEREIEWRRGHFPFRPAADRMLPPRGSVGIYIALQHHGYWVELSQSLFPNAPKASQVEAHQSAAAAFDELMFSLRPGDVDYGAHENDVKAIWIHGTGLDRDEAPSPMDSEQALLDGDIAAVHVAVKRHGDVTFFGRQIAVSQASMPLVAPIRAALSARANS